MDCHIVRTWKNVIGCCFSLMLKRGYTVCKPIVVPGYNMQSVLIYIYISLSNGRYQAISRNVMVYSKTFVGFQVCPGNKICLMVDSRTVLEIYVYINEFVHPNVRTKDRKRIQTLPSDVNWIINSIISYRNQDNIFYYIQGVKKYGKHEKFQKM